MWTCHAPTTVTYGNGQVVAECSGFGRYAEECTTDAALISAAVNALPGLLDRLEAAEKCIDVLRHGGKIENGVFTGIFDALAAYDAAKAGAPSTTTGGLA